MRPLALVTGAADGVGLELARQFATNGFDLIITDQGSDLERARDILMDLGAEVFPVSADLSKFSGADSLYQEIKSHNRPLEALAINIATGRGGPFWESELKKDLELIRMNIMASVHLTRLILPDMIEQASGRILFTSPVSTDVVHTASMACLTSFAESLRKEIKETGVVVTALLPGQSDMKKMARLGFLTLMRGKNPFKTKITEWARNYVHRAEDRVS